MPAQKSRSIQWDLLPCKFGYGLQRQRLVQLTAMCLTYLCGQNMLEVFVGGWKEAIVATGTSNLLLLMAAAPKPGWCLFQGVLLFSVLPMCESKLDLGWLCVLLYAGQSSVWRSPLFEGLSHPSQLSCRVAMFRKAKFLSYFKGCLPKYTLLTLVAVRPDFLGHFSDSCLDAVYSGRILAMSRKWQPYQMMRFP